MGRTPQLRGARPQVSAAREEQVLLARLREVEGQAEVLEGRVLALGKEVREDMKAWTKDCKMAGEELMRLLTTVDGVQVKTAAVRTSKKGLSTRLIKAMDMNDTNVEARKEMAKNGASSEEHSVSGDSVDDEAQEMVDEVEDEVELMDNNEVEEVEEKEDIELVETNNEAMVEMEVQRDDMELVKKEESIKKDLAEEAKKGVGKDSTKPVEKEANKLVKKESFELMEKEEHEMIEKEVQTDDVELQSIELQETLVKELELKELELQLSKEEVSKAENDKIETVQHYKTKLEELMQTGDIPKDSDKNNDLKALELKLKASQNHISWLLKTNRTKKAPLKGEADGESEISEKLVAAHDQIVSLKTALETKVLEETKGAKSVKETKVLVENNGKLEVKLKEVMAQLEKEKDKVRRLGLVVQNSEDANEEIKKELAAAEAKNDELNEDIDAKEESEYNLRIKFAETNTRGEEEKNILEDKLKAAAEKEIELVRTVETLTTKVNSSKSALIISIDNKSTESKETQVDGDPVNRLELESLSSELERTRQKLKDSQKTSVQMYAEVFSEHEEILETLRSLPSKKRKRLLDTIHKKTKKIRLEDGEPEIDLPLPEDTIERVLGKGTKAVSLPVSIPLSRISRESLMVSSPAGQKARPVKKAVSNLDESFC